jgi:protein involved in polysaccharide export with SLBB domain
MKVSQVLTLFAVAFALLVSTAYGTGAYRVGRGDILNIEVFKEKDFTGDFAIDDFGRLHYPIVGDIPVDGKTLDEVRDLLFSLISKDYLVNPKVTVTVKEFNSKKVMVLGSVGKPGVYPLKDETKILDIITTAGGINRDGSLKIVVLRKLSVSPVSQPEQPPAAKAMTEQNPLAQEKNLNEIVKKDLEVNKEQIKDLKLPSPIEKESGQLSPVIPKASPVPEVIEAKTLNKETVPEISLEKKRVEIPDPIEIRVKGSEIGLVPAAPLKAEIEKNIPTQMSNLKLIMVDYAKILKGGDLSQNIDIEGGDIINVPRANEVFVFGSVKSPGPVRYEDSMGVLQAVTLAGGPSPEASPGSTYILRMSDAGKEEKISINLSKILKQKAKNIEVRANDVIVVPESFF